ncbi:hypothetical protein F2Q68_00017258 [Brassica cretica]|uniref:Uncharacterized protein n=1 Tax=Brassica cretica TaxID=69181 RepID=A0A8S9HR02_BRACR|nr:hypothetical protein F2Q68_00017258 [Brassica cretica]
MASGRLRLRNLTPRNSYASTFLGQVDPSVSTYDTSSGQENVPESQVPTAPTMSLHSSLAAPASEAVHPNLMVPPNAPYARYTVENLLQMPVQSRFDGTTQHLLDSALEISSGQTFGKRIRTGLFHRTTFGELGSSA